jgi:UDP-galactopyranose mutase
VSERYDYLVVGAGFAGAVLAERLADAGRTVLVIDRRLHVAGNAYDERDEAGVLIHRYGPHIFHTNADKVVSYLSRFTDWRPYEHRVLASVEGKLLPIPINRTTVNAVFGLDLETEDDVEALYRSLAEPRQPTRTSEDVVLGRVGRRLYELFFRGYTHKQWGVDPSELTATVTARVPARTNDDDRYFSDSFQGMPADGYTAMFERMLDHPNIELGLGSHFDEIRGRAVRTDHVIFTGPIDEYFGYRFGRLPYRSLTFRSETLDQEWAQAVAVINHPNEHAYTRVTEFKHLTGQRHPRTSLMYEFPTDEGDPYYPIPRAENEALYKRYQALADATTGVTFVGRLGTYRYYNMDQVVAQALATFERLEPTRAAAAA